VPPQLAVTTTAKPLDPAVVVAITAEHASADWQGVGIDPVRYVEDRLSRPLFIEVLQNEPTAKVVLHVGARSFGDVVGLDPQKITSANQPNARDFPARVGRAPDGTFHVVGLVGEDWTLQLLHSLAVVGVDVSRVSVATVREPSAVVAADLDATLEAHHFDSIVVGTVGELTRAVERVLRARDLPRHVEETLGRMAQHLETQAQTARPDRQQRWRDRADLLQDLRARHPDPLACLAAVEADPVVGPPLADLVRAAKEGAPAAALGVQSENGKARVITHRVLEVEGKKHLILHVGGAHGDLAGIAVAHALAKQPWVAQVGFYGTCGSLDAKLPPDTFLRPIGALQSIERGRGPVQLDNAAALPGLVDVAHTNVSTLLREHRQGLLDLQTKGQSVDVESYHVARAVQDAGRPVTLRAILRVSDVATDPSLGAHRSDRAGTSDYEARRVAEEAVVQCLGLVSSSSSLMVTRPASDGGVP
jgi:hypothetical protein